MRSRILGLVLVLIAIASALVVWSRPLSGVVEKVKDGDSLVVAADGRTIEVRLHGVDAPEAKQAGGDAARRFTERLALGRTVELRVETIDDYGRSVAEVRLPDGSSLNERLVRAGWAWWYRRYSSSETLRRLEEEARRERRGVWIAVDPQPPWEYRRDAREKKPTTDVDAPFVGNVRSQVFHRKDCRNAGCSNCRRPFDSEAAARSAGFRRGGCCRP